MSSKVNGGWGYNTAPTGRGTEIEKTESPSYTGTIKTVTQQIDSDRAYQSMRNCVHMSRSWFIRYNKKWHKILEGEENFDWLMTRNYDKNESKYLFDEIDVKIED